VGPPGPSSESASERPTVESPSPAAVSAKPNEARVFVGRYEVEGVLGEGGFGAVFRVFDRELRRRAALKVIHANKRDEKKEKRFLNEARAMAKLSHPACVQVFDVGVDHEGVPYLVMELVQGEPLIEAIARGVLSPRRAALVLHTIAGALSCVHEAGLIHRDLKPHNILVGASGAKLADFGIVKDEEVTANLTAPGAMIGTLAYMPPEQTARTGETIDARADIYALGSTLYHCLVGAPPFSGPQPVLLAAVLEKMPVAPSRLNPEVPADLEAICLKCLEKKRDRRYQTAQEVADELARFLADEPIKARSPGALERARKTLRKHGKLVAWVLGSLLLALLALVAWRIATSLGARAAAEREFARGDEAFEAKDYDRAAEAYLNAARLDGALAVRASGSARRAQAGRLVQQGEAAFARFAKLEVEMRRDGSIRGTNAPGGAHSPVGDDRRAAVDAARAEAELAYRDAFVLAPDGTLAKARLDFQAREIELLADDDPKAADTLASEADKLAAAFGLATLPLGRVSWSVPSGTRARVYRYVLDAELSIERPVPVDSGGKTGAAAPREPGPFALALAPDLGAKMTLTLPAGDYLAVFEAEGSFEARVPFAIARRPQPLVLEPGLVSRSLLGDRADDFALVTARDSREARRAPPDPSAEPRAGRPEPKANRNDEFLMMKSEVSRELWNRWPRNFAIAPLDEGDPTAPVRGVMRAQVKPFADWYGSLLALDARSWEVRLPTRAEYQAAVRGSLQRAFPWGSVFRAPFLEHGARQDESPFGIRGLGGDVAELTYDVDPDTSASIVAGGAEGDLEGLARVALAGERCLLPEGRSRPDVGFRLVVARK
jgi:hypothetical protein